MMASFDAAFRAHVPVLMTSAALAADGELLHLAARFEVEWAKERASCDAAPEEGRDEVIAALQQPCFELAQKIQSLEAASLAGLGAKAIVFAWLSGAETADEDDDTAEGRLLNSIMRDVLARATDLARPKVTGATEGLDDIIASHRAAWEEYEAVVASLDDYDDSGEAEQAAFNRAEDIFERICKWPVGSHQEAMRKAQYLAGTMEFNEFDLRNLKAFVLSFVATA